MGSPRKEDNIIKLFLEHSPLKTWRFSEVMHEAKVTRAVANKWLQRYVNEGLLHHVKEKGKRPYFTAGQHNPVYRSLKRIYALEQLHNSGLIPELLKLPHAKTIILFGSISRGDWYKDSDIDLFILGDASPLNKKHFEQILGRTIELHLFEDKKELEEVQSGLLNNVVDGYVIKGHIQDIAEVTT